MPLRLAHVSDIHFAGYGETWDFDADQRDELLHDVERMVQTGGPIDGIVVGGDIAFSASPNEYDAASTWLDNLRVSCGGLDSGRVWTVPGNHDVDRSILGQSPVSQEFRQQVRQTDLAGLNGVLRARLVTDPAAAGLLAALDGYNAFAAGYNCDVTCGQPHWFDESLEFDGLTVRLLGLNSVIVSDENDSEADESRKLVLGTTQCTVPRRPETVHVVMAHHPPGWVRDWDVVEPYLRRAHVWLFGHEHAYRARQSVALGTVEINAGAVGPERHNGAAATGAYAPTYNVLTFCRDNDLVRLTVQPRYWNAVNTCFDEHAEGESEFLIGLPQPPSGSEPGPGDTGPDSPVPGRTALEVVPRSASPLAADGDELVIATAPPAAPPRPKGELRRTSSDFMRMAWTRRIAIARRLGVVEDHDLQIPDAELFPLVLRRVRDRGLVARLIEELGNA